MARPPVTRERSFCPPVQQQHHNPFPKEGRLLMTFRYRRALSVAVVAAAAGAAPLVAQAPTPPQISAGALIYTQYVYQLKDSVNHFNNFDITRSYLNALGRFADGVTTRLLTDVQRVGVVCAIPADNSLRLRLKY